MATGAGITWTPSFNEIVATHNNWIERIGPSAMYIAADIMANRIEDWMKENAPWQDRTGEARRQLSALAVQIATDAYIYMTHGVPYGDALETMQGGRFAILGPSVTRWLPLFTEVMKEVAGGEL